MIQNPKQQALESILNDANASFASRALAGDALRYIFLQEDDRASAEAVAQQVITYGTRANQMSFDKEVYDALERAYVVRSRNDFHCALVALEWNRPLAERFYQPRLSIMRPVAEAVTDLIVNDVYDILEVSMAPRVGKTTLGLFAVTWCAARNPMSPILMVSYAEKIVKMFYGGINEVYDDSITYNLNSMFSLLNKVDQSAKDLTIDFRDDGNPAKKKYPTVTCRSIDGALHGATEARQLLYCDDLVSGIEEAKNLDRMDKLWESFITDVRSRKKQGCKELHIGTRWSIHDPLTRISEDTDSTARTKVIIIPALDENDESNFDYSHGVGFDTAYYRELRESYRKNDDEVTWECVYQQNPMERGMLVFPREKFTRILTLPPTKEEPPDDIFAYCDVAFGGADYLALPIAYQYGDGDPIIVDTVFMRGDYEATEPIVAGRLMRYGVRRVIFEANNGGDFYGRDIARLLKAQGFDCHITSKRAESNKSKKLRIEAHQAAIKSFVLLDDSVSSAEYKMFVNNLVTYTADGKNQNDDAPDSLAGLAAMMRSNLNATLQVYDRKHI